MKPVRPPRAGQWVPDLNLVAYARMGGVRVVDLCGPDRAWVVAGLTAGGLTAEQCADLLKCSLRLVRQIKAEPMTVVAVFALGVQEDFDRVVGELDRVRRECEREVGRAAAEVARVKGLRSFWGLGVSGRARVSG